MGPRIAGTDVDEGDVLTYSFTSANSLFAIDSATGQVTLKSASLNYEAKATHTMQVRVTDRAGASATNTFTVNVEDINEPPVISSASRTIPENVGAGFQVGSAEMAKVQQVATYAKRNGAELIVAGFADSVGTEEYNRGLGDRRALAVRSALVNSGVNSAKIQTVSFGEEMLADAANPSSGRNRRVEFGIVR